MNTRWRQLRKRRLKLSPSAEDNIIVSNIVKTSKRRQRKKSHSKKELLKEKPIQEREPYTPPSYDTFTKKQIAQSANEGFERTENTPFDVENVSRETSNEISQSELNRRNTFAIKHGIFGSDYDTATSILGSSVFRQLKETTWLTSSQILDMFEDFRGITKAEDIELAMLRMIKDTDSTQAANVDALLDAMSLGFTLDEAEYLLSSELNNGEVKYLNQAPEGYALLRDYLIDILMDSSETQELKNYLWSLI